MKYDHNLHTKLVAKLNDARKKADKYLAKDLKSGETLKPTNFDDMKKAFDAEDQARKDLWEYLHHFIGPDGRIHFA